MPTHSIINKGFSFLYNLAAVMAALFLIQGCTKDAPTEGGGPSAPNPPSNLQATSVGYDRMKLTWTDNSSNESGFRVERSSAGGSGFQPVATVGPNVVTVIDSGLNPATTYQYRVSAFNGSGASVPSNVLSASTATSLAALFPLAPGTVWQYGVDQEYGFSSYYGSSNTHFQGTKVLYVDRAVSMSGRDGYNLYSFTRGLSSDTSFNVETITLSAGPSALEKYVGTSWVPILSATATQLNDFTFFFAPGPSNSGASLRSTAAVTVPAGSFSATLTEHHFKEDGQYATHHIYEDQWEYFSDGKGLVKSKWNFSDDDKDPMGADMWNRGTITLETGQPLVLGESEPNDSALFNCTDLNTLPGIVRGDISLADPGQVVNYRNVNPNKNSIKLINDWFSFSVSSTRRVIINLVAAGAANDVDLYLFKVNAGGSPAFLSQTESCRPAGCRELIDATLGGPATYLIGLQAWDTPGTRATYWMSVK